MQDCIFSDITNKILVILVSKSYLQGYGDLVKSRHGLTFFDSIPYEFLILPIFRRGLAEGARVQIHPGPFHYCGPRTLQTQKITGPTTKVLRTPYIAHPRNLVVRSCLPTLEELKREVQIKHIKKI